MTLLEKIEAYVASQGNQVGGGSEFADLLKEIVNSIPEGGGGETIVVNGTVEDGIFTEDPGQINLNQATSKYLAGANIIIRYVDGDPLYETIISYDVAGLILYGKNVQWGEG